MRWSPVEAQEHGFVHPVGDEEEDEGHGVDGEHSSGVRHRNEQQRQKIGVSRLFCVVGVDQGGKDERKENCLLRCHGCSFVAFLSAAQDVDTRVLR